MKHSLAIIGAGSSGLITLKTALEKLSDWEITCFEGSDSIRGCWGNLEDDFLSTSTKYTTQFSCFPKFDESLDASNEKREFFHGQEFGEYLEEFADAFQLRSFIELETQVENVERSGQEWVLRFRDGEQKTFSHLIVCTGLVQRPQPVDVEVPALHSRAEWERVKGQTVVVMGGGESAAEVANQLARPENGNEVFLSLRGGIRVSPRFHPIKGVPSDFLRNRLLLSIRRSWRNSIGQKFVEARIRFQAVFEKVFPSKKGRVKRGTRLAREWDRRLTGAAKDGVFSMFHNKSDGFLEAVGEERINIIGPAVDRRGDLYFDFESETRRKVCPDLVVPSIGFESGLAHLFSGKVMVSEFYRGCVHYRYENLFLIGFARPIIGNIPSISEQQALYTVAHLAGSLERTSNFEQRYQAERVELKERFPQINSEKVYPVEMIPYCDLLAQEMGTFPSLNRVASLSDWLNRQLSPATTLHYLNYPARRRTVYTPVILNLLLGLIRSCDWVIGSREPKEKIASQA